MLVSYGAEQLDPWEDARQQQQQPVEEPAPAQQQICTQDTSCRSGDIQ